MSLKVIGARIFQAGFGLVNRHLKDIDQQLIKGPGSFAEIGNVLKTKGLKNPMIVTGPRIAASEFFREFADSLEGDYVLFSEVRPDPTVSQIEEMVSLYRKEHCDSIIAIGGGSNIDAAKGMAARIVRPRKSLAQMGGVMKVLKKTPFFIAVPTTAGTGSECTISAVVTDDKANHKYGVHDPVLAPDVAILDPKLTVSLPKNLTAYTGMDALTHAVEAYFNKVYQKKVTPKLAEEAVQAVFAHLKDAYENGEDLVAREEMLVASYKAGQAFTVACIGNVHAIAHTFGGVYHVQHGLANAVILPYVLEESRPKIDKDLARLAELIGADQTLTVKQKADFFVDSIRNMNKELGIPEHLEMLKEEDVLQMATWAEKEANPLYPVPVIFDLEDFIRVIKKVGNL